MAEIHAIRPDIANMAMPNEPDPILVEYLEGLLEEARAGQIQGIVWVSLHPGDTTSWGRAGLVTAATIGKLEIAKMHCVRQSIEDEEAECSCS
jgi:hypothetical protein